MRLEYNLVPICSIKCVLVTEPKEEEEKDGQMPSKDVLNKYGYNAVEATHLVLERKIQFPLLRLTASVDHLGQDKRLRTIADSRQQTIYSSIHTIQSSFSVLRNSQTLLGFPLCDLRSSTGALMENPVCNKRAANISVGLSSIPSMVETFCLYWG